jgi:hypothetical protein
MKTVVFLGILIFCLCNSLSALAGSICPGSQKQIVHCFWQGWPEDKPCYVPLCQYLKSKFMEKVICEDSKRNLTLYQQTDREAWSAIPVNRKQDGGEIAFSTPKTYSSDDPQHQYPNYSELRITPINGTAENSQYHIYVDGAGFSFIPKTFHCDILD